VDETGTEPTRCARAPKADRTSSAPPLLSVTGAGAERTGDKLPVPRRAAEEGSLALPRRSDARN